MERHPAVQWLVEPPTDDEPLRLHLRVPGDPRRVAVLRVLAGPMAGAVGMAWPRFFMANLAGALLWACSMVSLAWLGGRWLPFERMVKSVLEFGLGALVLVCLSLLLPRLFEQLESRWPGDKRRSTQQAELSVAPLSTTHTLEDANLP